jgi:hypothetical protein
MKRALLEKSFVIVLFVLVMVIFSFAERDTQKLFEKYNVKGSVEVPRKMNDYTAEIPEKAVVGNKMARN